ncbi:MAG: hypothetical protein ABIM99_00405 [Candidatus Dojkabacteria bacterium]
MATEAQSNSNEEHNLIYRDRFGLNEDGVEYVDIHLIISDDGFMNMSVITIIDNLFFGFKRTNQEDFLDLIIDNPEDEDTKDLFISMVYWKDRIAILKYFIDQYIKAYGHNSKPAKDFDFNPFLKQYITSIIEG